MATTNCSLIEIVPSIVAGVISLFDQATGIAPVAGNVFKRPREYPLPVLSRYFKERNAPFRDPIIVVVPKVGGGVYWLSVDEVVPGPGTIMGPDGLQVTGDVFASVLNLSVVEAINIAGSFVGTIKNGVITV